MAERAPSAKKTIVKFKRTLRIREECGAALSGGFRTSPQGGECPKMRVVGTFGAEKPPLSGRRAPKRNACPKTSVFGRLALRARANALAVILFSEVMRFAPRPLRFGTRSRRTRYAPPFRAPRSRHSPTQPGTYGTPNKPARYAGLIFFHSETP